jgi:ribosomal protein S18 acetylase RimI-like enzyme
MLLPLTFRKADSQDVHFLFGFINSAYRGDSAREGWTFESDLVGGLRITIEEIHVIINSVDEFLLLAMIGPEIVASILVRDEGQCMYIGILAVKPDYQNQGIGWKLMSEVEKRNTATQAEIARIRKLIDGDGVFLDKKILLFKYKSTI